MADINSSLPIRTEADVDQRLQSKIIDFTNPNSGMSVVSGNAYVQVHGLNAAGDDETIRLSELGHMTLDGVYNASTNTDPSNAAVVLHERNATPDDTHSTLRQTAIQNGTSIAADVALRDSAGNGLTSSTAGATQPLDTMLRDASGASYSAANPFPVAPSADVAGDEVNDYDTVASVAANATSNHDYTVTGGTTLILTQIEAAASGKMKIEVQVEGPAATFTTKFVKFNSTADTGISIKLASPIQVAAGLIVRIIRTNLDKNAQDVYSTISGQEV